MHRFRADCSASWRPLRQAVGAEPGELVATVEVDGRQLIDLLFASYGQVCGVPVEEVEPVPPGL